jgi:hypothetical protein
MPCSETVNHSRVKVEENSSKAVFLNPERVLYKITEIDGCVVKNGIRCDKVVSEVGSISVLVELKGSDVSHACEQLFASANDRAVQDHLEGKLGFLVVCTRYPRFDSYVAKAKQMAAKRYKAGFHVVQSHREFDIARVAAIDGPT